MSAGKEVKEKHKRFLIFIAWHNRGGALGSPRRQRRAGRPRAGLGRARGARGESALSRGQGRRAGGEPALPPPLGSRAAGTGRWRMKRACGPENTHPAPTPPRRHGGPQTPGGE